MNLLQQNGQTGCLRKDGRKTIFLFFGGSIAVLAIIIIGTFYLYEIVPGNSKLSAEINVLPAKTPRHAKFSATAFITKLNLSIVVWPLLIGRKIFADLM